MAKPELDLYRKLKQLDKLKRDYALFLYQPYPKQKDFHNSEARERLLMAGNRLGKCATISSYIIHPDGTRSTFGELLDKSEFPVFAWDGEKIVRAIGMKPIKKPPEPCIRLWFSDGSWFECALRHRMLLASGGYTFVQNLLLSNLEPCQSIHAEDDRHLNQIPSGFLSDCLVNFRLCDALLHHAANSVRVFVRQRIDALQYNSALSGLDVYLSINTNNLQPKYARLSNLYEANRIGVRFFEFLDQGACKFARYSSKILQAGQQFLLGLISRSRSNDGFHPDLLQGAFVTPGIGGNKIIAYELIGSHDVYDFTVPIFHNYMSCGVFHHNTYCAGAEISYHLTGLYPDWWEGRRINHAPRIWVGSVTAELCKDGAQRVLLGPANRLGSGLVPNDRMMDVKRAKGVPDAIETFQVKHISGENSQVTFKSYKDGREAWQADEIDVVWLDEEPPQDVYTEALTRTNNTNGFLMMTFTPLMGMTEVVMRFLNEKSENRHVVNMTIDDALHYDDETRKKIYDSYKPHEREARLKGIPMLGSGRVFPIPEESIREPQLQRIPEHWPQIIGIDFGWDHPTSAVRLAYDRENDCIHVLSCYRKKEETPIVHSAALRAWGDWIPVAWPQDALQHDKGSGEQLADIYKKQGLKMLSEYATFPDDRGRGHEAGVMDMLSRMQTGRLKVDENLFEWWEEFRMYHRKDGKIIKIMDDCLDATRYGMMMLRFAIARAEGPKERDKYSRISFWKPTWMSA